MARKRGRSSFEEEDPPKTLPKTSNDGVYAVAPFQVQYPPGPNRKLPGKTLPRFNVGDYFEMPSGERGLGFDDARLDTFYMVEPREEWQGMRRYNNFVRESV